MKKGSIAIFINTSEVNGTICEILEKEENTSNGNILYTVKTIYPNGFWDDDYESKVWSYYFLKLATPLDIAKARRKHESR